MFLENSDSMADRVHKFTRPIRNVAMQFPHPAFVSSTELKLVCNCFEAQVQFHGSSTFSPLFWPVADRHKTLLRIAFLPLLDRLPPMCDFTCQRLLVVIVLLSLMILFFAAVTLCRLDLSQSFCLLTAPRLDRPYKFAYFSIQTSSMKLTYLVLAALMELELFDNQFAIRVADISFSHICCSLSKRRETSLGVALVPLPENILQVTGRRES